VDRVTQLQVPAMDLLLPLLLLLVSPTVLPKVSQAARMEPRLPQALDLSSLTVPQPALALLMEALLLLLRNNLKLDMAHHRVKLSPVMELLLLLAKVMGPHRRVVGVV
jgi:hypothetical protein